SARTVLSTREVRMSDEVVTKFSRRTRPRAGAVLQAARRDYPLPRAGGGELSGEEPRRTPRRLDAVFSRSELAIQDAAERGGVDVAAAQDDAHRLAFELRGQLPQAGETGSTGALGEVVRR